MTVAVEKTKQLWTGWQAQQHTLEAFVRCVASHSYFLRVRALTGLIIFDTLQCQSQCFREYRCIYICMYYILLQTHFISAEIHNLSHLNLVHSLISDQPRKHVCIQRSPPSVFFSTEN